MQHSMPRRTPTTRGRRITTAAGLACGLMSLLATPTTHAAGVVAPAASDTRAAQPATPGSERFTVAELEELVGPIALYPDSLLANVLGASVYPDDVAAAATYVSGGGTDIDAQSWDVPVKAVARVPDAIKMMGQYPDWVAAVGQAYITQAADVMSTVQTLRALAMANGALADSPQQNVEEDGDTIIIVPAEPEVVYVPTYTSSVVYAPYQPGTVATAAVAFGVGVAVGAVWADCLDCHWNSGCVGWGWGGNDVNIDVDREFNGDINIGSGNTNINGGNRVRTGQEGNAWSPNQQRASSQARPNAASQYRTRAAGNARATPSGGWGGRGQAAGTRPSGTRQNAARPTGTRNMPATPPRQTSGAGRDGAYQGGGGTRASSNRGNNSRGTARSGGGGGGRSSGARPSRGGGGGGRRR